MLIEKINQNKKSEKLHKMLIRCHNKQKQMEESGETDSKKYRDIVENVKKLEIYYYGVGIDFMIYDC